MSVRRDDLLALQTPALAALTNMGLVKRAQKEIEQGKMPVVVVDDDGTVTVTFDDGSVTRLVPGKGVRDAPCSCGAGGGCRHRVGAVLAYQRSVVDGADAGDSDPHDSIKPESTKWSPGDVTDAALAMVLGEGTVDRASKLRRAGYIADVRRGTFVGEDLPVVHLQTSSVRFLVPDDVSYARCDCTQKTGCLHVALAVWAFRTKNAKDREAPSLTVEVTAGDATADARRAPIGLSASLDVMRLIVDDGIARLPPAAAGRIALATDALRRAGLTWPLLAVEELETLIDRYRRRSALFHPERLRAVLVEVVARARAGRGEGLLPSRAVLGADEALSTKLDQARFIGLGATVEEDGDDRSVQVLFVDPSGQGTLAWERTFKRSDAVADEDGPALGNRVAVAGSSLSVLSSGQVVSNAVTRLANRCVTFSTGGLQKTSVTRGGFSLERLPADRTVTDVAAFIADRRTQAPVWLRPRLVADDVRVVVLHEVREQWWDPAQQAMGVHAVDVAGGTIVIERSHRAIAPGAVQAMALAFAGATMPSAVVGHVRLDGDTLLVAPIAVFTDHLVVLDLEAESAAGAAAQAALPTGAHQGRRSALSQVADDIAALLDEVVLNGVRAMTPSSLQRATGLVRRARDAGLTLLGDDLDGFVAAATALSITGSDLDAAAAADAWGSVALRLSLVAERV